MLIRGSAKSVLYNSPDQIAKIRDSSWNDIMIVIVCLFVSLFVCALVLFLRDPEKCTEWFREWDGGGSQRGCRGRVPRRRPPAVGDPKSETNQTKIKGRESDIL